MSTLGQFIYLGGRQKHVVLGRAARLVRLALAGKPNKKTAWNSLDYIKHVPNLWALLSGLLLVEDFTHLKCCAMLRCFLSWLEWLLPCVTFAPGLFK